MATGFPPKPTFPLAIDSDKTLFLVYNTAETPLNGNNPAWSDEIDIIPVSEEKEEIWANNGFANIAGELFYYDSVEKDINGKVCKLKRCLRNLGGTKTQFNYSGEMVRGFVVAEHHNQIVDAIINIEEFVGQNFDTDEATLDWRIRNIKNEEVCIDDWECPDVDFQFDLPQSVQEGEVPDRCAGVTTVFNISINGRYTRYSLDFGDGNITTDLSGSHQYTDLQSVDPVITVANEKCETILAAKPRSDEPTGPSEAPFDIPIPEIPNFTPFILPEIITPSTTLTLPQIVFPAIDTGSFNASIPSFSFNIGDFNIPSMINFGDIPNTIYFGPLDMPLTISFVGSIEIPLTISFVGSIEIPQTVYFGSFAVPPNTIFFGSVNIPPTINFGSADILKTIYFGSADIAGTIYFGPVDIAHTIYFGPIDLTVSWGNVPWLTVDWGNPIPYVTVLWGTPPPVTVVVTCSSGAPMMMNAGMAATDANFQDNLNQEDIININADSLGIPSEIKVISPKFPDIKILHDIPTNIKIDSPDIPNIAIDVPDDFPKTIELVASDSIPKSIHITHEIPSSIRLEVPSSIRLEIPDIPAIPLDASGLPKNIQVVGIPSIIELKGSIPSEIMLKAPENLEVPLVYKGGPIPIKFDAKDLLGDDTDTPCFAIIPCGSKK